MMMTVSRGCQLRIFDSKKRIFLEILFSLPFLTIFTLHICFFSNFILFLIKLNWQSLRMSWLLVFQDWNYALQHELFLLTAFQLPFEAILIHVLLGITLKIALVQLEFVKNVLFPAIDALNLIPILFIWASHHKYNNS